MINKIILKNMQIFLKIVENETKVSNSKEHTYIEMK